ncbi:unnamed protein product [Bursaphelenchus okinawaensis]|uniref:G_PROTEIN_RECEP_F1_2 domain-containing protein n=1 Tax=Bursaphelenchus okinawaensis TaxID=465554 RepID=A0A811KUN6_9BILA|nr:unnamed protein product [Bursaphelenchus okinawaensis]CAG9112218.1 unnamed protein product [Bursaphelenchus okinawaensis]
MNPQEIQSVSERCAIIISAFFNVILFLLTVTEKNSSLKSYRNLLLLNILTESLFTLFIALSQVTLQFLDGAFIAISNGPFKHLPYEYHCYIVSLYILGIGMSFITLPIDFIYRYLIVCRRTQVKLKYLIIFTVLAYAWALWDSYWITISFLTTPDVKETYGSLLSQDMWFEDGKQVTFLAASFDTLSVKIFVLSAALIIFIVYLSVFIIGRHVFKELSSKRHTMSKKTMEMQRGMNRMLIAQAIIPIFTGLLPLIVMLVSTSMRWKYQWTGFFTYFCICWLPTIGPICAIYFITSFRKRLFSIFSQQFKKTSVINSLHNISSH